MTNIIRPQIYQKSASTEYDKANTQLPAQKKKVGNPYYYAAKPVLTLPFERELVYTFGIH